MLGAGFWHALGNEGLQGGAVDAGSVRLVGLASFLLAEDLGSRGVGPAALVLAGLLGCFLLPAGGRLTLLLHPLLGGNAVGLCLNAGALGLLSLQLELEALVLGFALLRSGLVKQFLLSAGCGFAFCLLLLGHSLALGLNRSLLCQPDAVLFGALFGFAAQPGQLGLLCVVLLPGRQRFTKHG